MMTDSASPASSILATSVLVRVCEVAPGVVPAADRRATSVFAVSECCGPPLVEDDCAVAGAPLASIPCGCPPESIGVPPDPGFFNSGLPEDPDFARTFPNPDAAPAPPCAIACGFCITKFTSYARSWQLPQCATRSERVGLLIRGSMLHCPLMTVIG